MHMEGVQHELGLRVGGLWSLGWRCSNHLLSDESITLELALLLRVVVVVDGAEVVGALVRDAVSEVSAVVRQVLASLWAESEALGTTALQRLQITENEGLVGPRIVHPLDDAVLGGDVTSDLLL